MDVTSSRFTRALFLCCLSGSVSVAMARECRLEVFQPHQAVQTPQLQPGTTWVYSVGADVPTTQLTLESASGGVAQYTINGTVTRKDRIADYAQLNPRRQGRMEQIRFPISVGMHWTDSFAEPGEVTGPWGTYRYDYQESAVNDVVGIETIRTGVGEVQAFRIERVARWTKSNPVSSDMYDYKAAENGETVGVDQISSWYAPALGRVVLRVQGTIHPAWFRSDTELEDRLNSTRGRVTELVGYHDAGDCELDGPPVWARLEDRSVPPRGYKMRDNDTWEFRMSRDPHIPLMHDEPMRSLPDAKTNSETVTSEQLDRIWTRLEPAD